MKSSWLFELRGEIKSRYFILLLVSGLLFILLVWLVLTSGETPLVPSGILPHPLKVVMAYADLWNNNELLRNITTSYALNLGGYVKALLWSLPLGFLVGLIPLFRGSFQHIVNALRYLPLTAVTSLFIVWFGIYTEMKMNFLAFGIFLYLLPTIIQRIDEVEDVYLTTVYTLGASKWQTFRTVYFPAVLAKLSDDIRVLTAISWTYIIVIENIGSEGGLGFLLHGPSARQGRVDKMFALLILIMIIGVVQDRVFLYLDKKFFPHKYQLKDKNKAEHKQATLFHQILDFIIMVSGYILLGFYLFLASNEVFGFIENFSPLSYFFGDRLWVIHFFFVMVLVFLGYNFYKKLTNK
ncbi:MAG: ABC transporter permease subunit [Saprospiraceae bacterium]|nr:ABC transporter permease subunit [Saprospiraceae bacterium]